MRVPPEVLVRTSGLQVLELGPKRRQVLGRQTGDGGFLDLFHAAQKRSIGRLGRREVTAREPTPPPAVMAALGAAIHACARPGVTWMARTSRAMTGRATGPVRGGLLPGAHRDPCDRMLAAQAQVEAVPLVTADPAFGAFGTGVLW